MRVGLTCEHLNRKLTGIGHYTYRLLTSLMEVDTELEILPINDRDLDVLSEINSDYIVVESPFRMVDGSLDVMRIYSWYLKLPKAIKNFELDIVHNTSQTPTFFKFHQKYVITIHDLTLIKYPGMHMGLGPFMQVLLPKTLRTANAIIAPSQNTKEDLIRILGVPEEKIRVIPEACSPEFRPVEDAKIKKTLARLNIKHPYILNVGTLEPRKNVETLIRAFAKISDSHPEFRLVIAGSKGWKYSSIFKLVKNRGLQKKVVFLDYVAKEDLPALYNGAKVFVFPSVYEGFGLPPLEAMACGTAVITSNSSSIPEVVGDAGIMIPPFDVDGLAESIREILMNDALRVELEQKSLRRSKRFSCERMAKETYGVYKDIQGK